MRISSPILAFISFVILSGCLSPADEAARFSDMERSLTVVSPGWKVAGVKLANGQALIRDLGNQGKSRAFALDLVDKKGGIDSITFRVSKNKFYADNKYENSFTFYHSAKGFKNGVGLEGSVDLLTVETGEVCNDVGENFDRNGRQYGWIPYAKRRYAAKVSILDSSDQVIATFSGHSAITVSNDQRHPWVINGWCRAQQLGHVQSVMRQ